MASNPPSHPTKPGQKNGWYRRQNCPNLQRKGRTFRNTERKSKQLDTPRVKGNLDTQEKWKHQNSKSTNDSGQSMAMSSENSSGTSPRGDVPRQKLWIQDRQISAWCAEIPIWQPKIHSQRQKEKNNRTRHKEMLWPNCTYRDNGKIDRPKDA